MNKNYTTRIVISILLAGLSLYFLLDAIMFITDLETFEVPQGQTVLYSTDEDIEFYLFYEDMYIEEQIRTIDSNNTLSTIEINSGSYTVRVKNQTTNEYILLTDYPNTSISNNGTKMIAGILLTPGEYEIEIYSITQDYPVTFSLQERGLILNIFIIIGALIAFIGMLVLFFISYVKSQQGKEHSGFEEYQPQKAENNPYDLDDDYFT